MSRVEHTWGTEETWAATDRYVAKTILLRGGASTPSLCHKGRDKTLRVHRGTVTLHLEIEPRTSRDAHPGETIHVGAGVPHRLSALNDAELTEVSTPERAAPHAPLAAKPAVVAHVEPDPDIIIDDPEALTHTKPLPRPVVERLGAPVIVVVEDDLLIQDILVRAMGARYTIHTADDGAQGLALLEALPPVDLVITDLMMPRMTGLELMRNLKADPARGRIPVIMLTARAASADVAAAINAGARSYVTKPFKLKELLAQVEKITSAKSS